LSPKAIWENVHGADSRLNPSDQQTNDPNRQGGKRLDTALSINCSSSLSAWLSISVRKPISRGAIARRAQKNYMWAKAEHGVYPYQSYGGNNCLSKKL
jgi:hypothetical protein